MQTTLEILTHPLLNDVRHGFFTRKGGASSGLFAGLNCGRRSTDQVEMVAVNRARVAAAPAQLADLTRSAIASGCDPQALVDAVTDAATA